MNVPLTREYQLFFFLDSSAAQTIYGTVNQQNYQLILPANHSGWIPVGQFNLNQGNNDIVVVGYDRPVRLQLIAAVSLEPEMKAFDQIENWQALSPVDYRADLKLNGPGYLLFKETYHPAWLLTAVNRATGETLSLRPLIMNGWQQGYYLDQAGQYQLRLSYDLAAPYRVSLMVTVIGLIIIFVNIVIYCIIMTKALTHK
jgi:hypothetical protein